MLVDTEAGRFYIITLQGNKGLTLSCVGVDPCLWGDGTGQRRVSATRGVHTFYMQKAELEYLLTESLGREFEETFLYFCTREFSSHNYSGENMAPARLYLYYLKNSIEALISLPADLKKKVTDLDYSDDDIQTAKRIVCLSKGLLSEASHDQKNYDVISKAIGLYCYGATEKNKKDVNYYHTLFVQSWLEYFSEGN